MSEVYPLFEYVRLALIQKMEGTGWPGGFHRLEYFRQTFFTKYRPILEQYETGLSERRKAIALDAVFNELVENGVLRPLDGKLAGSYYNYNAEVFKTYQTKALRESEIYKVARQVGVNRYFGDVFEVSKNSPHIDGAFSEEDFDIRSFDTGPNIVIPASDRLVTLGHNQQVELESSATELISALEKENSIDGDPDTRSWMLGRLKAARELIRGGTLHVWLMQATILNVLQELSVRYKDHAIGVAASVLLELMIKHLFGIS